MRVLPIYGSSYYIYYHYTYMFYARGAIYRYACAMGYAISGRIKFILGHHELNLHFLFKFSYSSFKMSLDASIYEMHASFACLGTHRIGDSTTELRKIGDPFVVELGTLIYNITISILI